MLRISGQGRVVDREADGSDGMGSGNTGQGAHDHARHLGSGGNKARDVTVAGTRYTSARWSPVVPARTPRQREWRVVLE